jgi:four helix bundle protein
VGANYCEADDAVSKKDFKNKIGTCRKEARETKLWLRMIAAAEPELKVEARKLGSSGKRQKNCTSSLLPFGGSRETVCRPFVICAWKLFSH